MRRCCTAAFPRPRARATAAGRFGTEQTERAVVMVPKSTHDSIISARSAARSSAAIA